MTFPERVRALEAEGMTTSDAQGIADMEAGTYRVAPPCACGAALASHQGIGKHLVCPNGITEYEVNPEAFGVGWGETVIAVLPEPEEPTEDELVAAGLLEPYVPDWMQEG